MKESRHNLYIKDSTGMIIYNAISDEVVVLNPQLADLVDENKDDLKKIQSKHPELFAFLAKKGVFVDDAVDEITEYIAKMERADNESKEYTITINPTLACNMKCWYCYENHKGMPAMKPAVKDAIVSLIENLTGRGILRLNLSFFGGEPLLCFDTIVFDILRCAKEKCDRKSVKLSVHFTTNAFLLTGKVLNKLKGFDVSFQITIDGNEYVHNMVRKTKTDEPTYATIISNIYSTIDRGFSVGIRFNYTHQSLPSFIDVLSDFKDLPSAQRELISFNFQRVWQDKGGKPDEIQDLLASLESSFEKKGFKVNSANDYLVPYCYADKKNTVVINYDGNIYKCTARDFTHKNREGSITPNGHLRWNEKHEKRTALKYGSEFCRKCRIYPICHGGCSQMKLEDKTTSACPKGFDKEKIRSIMKGRALFILNRYKVHNK